MSPNQIWENMTDDTKILIKKIGFSAIGLYVAMQLLSFVFPIVLISAIGYWLYKSIFDKNPKILK